MKRVAEFELVLNLTGLAGPGAAKLQRQGYKAEHTDGSQFGSKPPGDTQSPGQEATGAREQERPPAPRHRAVAAKAAGRSEHAGPDVTGG